MTFAYAVGLVVGPLFAWFLVHVNRADRRRAALLDAEYGPQLAARYAGEPEPEPGSSSPEVVAVDADHVPVPGSVSS